VSGDARFDSSVGCQKGPLGLSGSSVRVFAEIIEGLHGRDRIPDLFFVIHQGGKVGPLWRLSRVEGFGPVIQASLVNLAWHLRHLHVVVDGLADTVRNSPYAATPITFCWPRVNADAKDEHGTARPNCVLCAWGNLGPQLFCELHHVTVADLVTELLYSGS
jgi:hypothetical protein